MGSRDAISMRGALSLGAALGVLTAASAAAEGPAGAAACSGCHAPVAAGLPVPSLEGRAAESILADMRAFSRGEKPATVMDRIAKGFSDEEARAIAEWLAKRNHAAIQP